MSSEHLFTLHRRLMDESILLLYQRMLLLIERTLQTPHTPNGTGCLEESLNSAKRFVVLQLPHLYGFAWRKCLANRPKRRPSFSPRCCQSHCDCNLCAGEAVRTLCREVLGNVCKNSPEALSKRFSNPLVIAPVNVQPMPLILRVRGENRLLI